MANRVERLSAEVISASEMGLISIGKEMMLLSKIEDGEITTKKELRRLLSL